MAILAYNEIRIGKCIIHNDEPFEVIESHVARTQQRKPQNQTKLRSLLSGRVITVSFHASDKASEADMDTRPIKFVYENRGEYTFCEVDNPSKRFNIPSDLIEAQAKYLKANLVVEALLFTPEDEDEPKIIGIRLPIKIEYKVKEAPPAVKGNTAQGAQKQVVLENGLSITTPLFINEGDSIIINTVSGEYVERAGKN
jgi:elongation factor P